MKQKLIHTKTIKSRVLFLMILIVIIQMISVIGIITLTDTINKLDSSSIEILTNSVTAREKKLEDMMNEFSQFSNWLKEVQIKVNEIESTMNSTITENIDNEKFREELLNELSSTVLPNLRKQRTTGAFLILDNPNNYSIKDAIYLRDLNPQAISENNHDILVKIGLGRESFNQGFTLDFDWTSKLTLDENRDFFDKPIKAVSDYPNLKAIDYGYWSNPIRLTKDDILIITYSIPIIDSSGKAFGIIGIDVSLDYLNTLIGESGISIDKNGAFFLGKTNEDQDVFSTVFVNNSFYKSQFQSKNITFKENSKSNMIENIFIDDNKTDYISSNVPLHLYNTNTPFEKEQWIFSGLVRNSSLYASSNKLKLALVLSLSISFIISVLGAISTTLMMFRPLRNFMQAIGKETPNHKPLPKTDIAEIDSLGKEIESLRINAFKAGSKVADIISLANLSLGVFEFDMGADFIFCTKSLFTLTELSLDGWNENYMKRESFINKMESLRLRLSPLMDETNIFFFITNEGTKKYIEVKCVSHDKNQLYLLIDVTSQIVEKEKIKHERDYDILTDLYNRRAFMRIVSNMLSDGSVKTGVFSMWDLDNLKFVNDTYGHDTGDKYLCLLSDLFHNFPYKNSVISRMSGDEFMLFLYNGDVEEMCNILEKTHQEFINKKLPLTDGSFLSVGASAGISIYGEDSCNCEALIKLADFAMYEIKHTAKGGIIRFNKDSYEKDYILVQGIGEFNKILEEELIDYVFQPIVDIRNKRIFAYEALMRPKSDILFNPEILLKIAEKQSKLKQVERVTWFNALKAYSAQKDSNSHEKLFINSISNQCMSLEDFDQLKLMYGNYFSKIVMEATEGNETDAEVSAYKGSLFKKVGIKTALDDYGAGYSNNAILLNSDFDYVKIDISMIKNIHLSEEKKTFVKNVIDFCHKCRTKVIVEGVETLEEYKIVEQLGTDLVQGYFFSRPVSNISDIHIDYDILD